MNHHDHQQPPPTLLPTKTGDCGNCGAHVVTFLFHVRLRGIHRRLCTKCVLKLHPSSFCPICFAFYDSNPPHPSKRYACSQCPSFTHSHCSTSPPSSPYLCPLCASNVLNDFSSIKRIDDNSAAMILCAAKIASASMGKALAVARVEAEKKAKDAAFARKKAREALERVALLISKSNQHVKDGGSVVQVSRSESYFNPTRKESSSQDYINSAHTDNKGMFANEVKPERNGITQL